MAAELASQVTKYNLLRLLFGYGEPTKRGFNADVNAGYDFVQNALQYGGIRAAYNWDCCGLSIEYRRLALGSVRNENEMLHLYFHAGRGRRGRKSIFQTLGTDLLIPPKSVESLPVSSCQTGSWLNCPSASPR
jgi:hypothetical protein